MLPSLEPDCVSQHDVKQYFYTAGDRKEMIKSFSKTSSSAYVNKK